MRKSARLLGLELGKSAREMNELLRVHGYLDGTPGSYSLTERGKKYGEEKHEHRGVGGYSWYNRDWTTRTWDEEILNALAGETDDDPIASVPEAGLAGEADLEENFAAPSQASFENDDEHEDADDGLTLLWLAIGGILIARAVVSDPRVKRWFNDAVTPGAKKMWGKITSSESTDATRGEIGIQEKATQPDKPTNKLGSTDE